MTFTGWRFMSDGKYHYSWNGESFCDYKGWYSRREEPCPPKKQRCKTCQENFKLRIVVEPGYIGRFFKWLGVYK
jgi:hypothetical protein